MTTTWESWSYKKVSSHINVMPSRIRDSDCILWFEIFCKILFKYFNEAFYWQHRNCLSSEKYRSFPSHKFDTKFHWQFLITYSGFWLVNILLWKFETLSKKEIKIKKTTKNVKKVYLNIRQHFFSANSPH